ncbi:MAG TPA: SoxY-related AACIE arm protein [Xanthobacteraceae bacterium]|nr:SoxY-related AACIE arm protein [Xanthobacteraceae bacterium]
MSLHRTGATRREILLTGAAGIGAALIMIEPAAATPETMQRAIRQLVGEAPIKKGKVTLDVPALVENGNSVALTIDVASAMTAKDYVKAIHVFNEKNPLPNVISAHLGPRSGRAKISTRFRLADTQTIVAIAELSDGTFWSASADVIVTLQACLENLD